MSSEAEAVLRSWSSPLWVNLSLCITGLVYVRGWFRIRRLLPEVIPTWRLAAFLSGLLSLWVAIGSPLAAFDDVSLSVHMVQHLLLMAVVPPLALLGAPSLPLLRGLPQSIVPWCSRTTSTLAACKVVRTFDHKSRELLGVSYNCPFRMARSCCL